MSAEADPTATRRAPLPGTPGVSEAIERVMDKAPDDGWKLLIALGRYGGLRIPSEVVGLKISDIDLERGRITIASPKTEKQGKSKRVIPLWPELRPLIEAVSTGALTRLTVVAPGMASCWRFEIGRRDLLKFWRGAKPLTAYA